MALTKGHRKRVPTALHKLRGNPGGRDLNRTRGDEPQFKTVEEVPKPPKSLKPPRKPKPTGNLEVDQEALQHYTLMRRKALYAVREWKRIGPELFEIGLLTKVSQRFFEAYCDSYSMFELSAEMAKKDIDGIFQMCGTKLIVGSWTRLKKESKEEMLKYGSEFGLTPSTSSKVSAGKKKSPAGSFLDKSKKLHTVK